VFFRHSPVLVSVESVISNHSPPCPQSPQIAQNGSISKPTARLTGDRLAQATAV